jgi:hypothetical protein
MATDIANLEKRSVQTTVSFPLHLYIRLLERAKTEGISLSEIVRRGLLKELQVETKEIGNSRNG